MKIKQCNICGVDYTAQGRDTTRRKTCSRKCGGIWQAKIRKGKPCHSEKWKQVLRERFLKDNPVKNPKVRKKISDKIKWMFKYDKNYIKKVKESNYKKGHPLEKNNNWKGGITEKCKKGRNNKKVKQWRKYLLKKYSSTCQSCGCFGKHVHHINSWVDFPELRFDVNNGIVFCNSCHIKEERKITKKFRTKGVL